MAKNCPILSQNVPKFELYKHNDELFSMYDRIFYELCELLPIMQIRKRGDEILIVHCRFSVSQNELKF